MHNRCTYSIGRQSAHTLVFWKDHHHHHYLVYSDPALSLFELIMALGLVTELPYTPWRKEKEAE